MFRTTVLKGLLLLCAPLASAQFQVSTCKNAFTPEQEIAEGQKVVDEVYKQMPVLPDTDPVSRYVRQLGARLVSAAPGTPGVERQWPFHFHVVASQEINAFALPGGTMFVNLGAIQAAETEAQLAGVMSHELAHVILRHSTCNLTRQQRRSIWYGLGAIGSQLALGKNIGGLAARGFGVAENLDFLHMSRGDEQQADLLGVHVAHDAGFDPRGLPQFFEIITAKYGAGGAQFLSDHPNPGNRTEHVDQEIALLPPLEHPVKSSPEFATAHRQAAAERTFTGKDMQAGTWKSTGLYAAGPGQPAGTIPATPGAGSVAGPAANVTRLPVSQLGLRDPLTRVRFAQVSIAAPASWQHTDGTQGGGSAVLAPPGGAGSFGVAYGVLLGTVRSNGGIRDENTLRTASDEVASGLMKSNGLTAAGEGSSLRVGGQPAIARDLCGTSPVTVAGRPQAERDWLVTVLRPDGDLGYLIFVAPEADAPTLRPLFESMLQSYNAQ